MIADNRLMERYLSKMVVVGINHQNTSAAVRSAFVITAESRDALLKEARQKACQSIFALSTCNRSEVYAFMQSDAELIDLFTKYTNSNAALFQSYGFIKRGREALQYFFNVAAGLNSQIVGDYEIVGQIKNAVEASRAFNLIEPLLDRVINYALQASKAVRTQTQISNGTVSVSYAAIQWLEGIENIQDKSVLVIGAGALGKSVLKNLMHYEIGRTVTVVNRTEAPTRALALETGAAFQPFEKLGASIAASDVIIVCTNAQEYIVDTTHMISRHKQLILDLSVPENVHPAIRNMERVQVVGIDEVSQKMQDTIALRNSEVPKAAEIIAGQMELFEAWLSMYQYSSLIHNFKASLLQLGQMDCGEDFSEDAIHYKVKKSVGQFAANLRKNNQGGCQVLHAMNCFLNVEMQQERSN